MATSGAKEAAEYLEKHKIAELMNNLTSSLLFERPGDPYEFLMSYLVQLRESKDTCAAGPCLFNDSNLDSVFRILDPTNAGHVTYEQYREALTTIGVSGINECPEGGEHNAISRETFKKEAGEGLQRRFTTYDGS